MAGMFPGAGMNAGQTAASTAPLAEDQTSAMSLFGRKKKKRMPEEADKKEMAGQPHGNSAAMLFQKGGRR